MQKTKYIGLQGNPIILKNIILKYIYQMLKKIDILWLFPTFLVEGNAKFQLEVSENKDVFFFPIQVHGSLEIYPRTPG
jgi:hypothetical protein